MYLALVIWHGIFREISVQHMVLLCKQCYFIFRDPVDILQNIFVSTEQEKLSPISY